MRQPDEHLATTLDGPARTRRTVDGIVSLCGAATPGSRSSGLGWPERAVVRALP